MPELASAPINERAHGGRGGKPANAIGALCDMERIGVECRAHTANAAFFEDWLGRLPPELPAARAIILGDAGFRGKTALEAAIKNSGRSIALLFLAPCGPDSNPIEKYWANLKEFLRNRGSSFEDLRAAINRHFQLDSL